MAEFWAVSPWGASRPFGLPARIDHWKTFRHFLTVANGQDFLGFFSGSLPPGGLEVSHALGGRALGESPLVSDPSTEGRAFLVVMNLILRLALGHSLSNIS